MDDELSHREVERVAPRRQAPRRVPDCPLRVGETFMGSGDEGLGRVHRRSPASCTQAADEVGGQHPRAAPHVQGALARCCSHLVDEPRSERLGEPPHEPSVRVRADIETHALTLRLLARTGRTGGKSIAITPGWPDGTGVVSGDAANGGRGGLVEQVHQDRSAAGRAAVGAGAQMVGGISLASSASMKIWSASQSGHKRTTPLSISRSAADSGVFVRFIMSTP